MRRYELQQRVCKRKVEKVRNTTKVFKRKVEKVGNMTKVSMKMVDKGIKESLKKLVQPKIGLKIFKGEKGRANNV